MAETRTHNLFNEITGINGDATAVSHDAAGNMTRSVTLSNDGVARPTVFTWDAWNRLTRLSDTSDITIAVYTYDGDWKRLKKTVGSVVTEYYYDDMQLAETRTNGAASEQFVYDSRYLHSVALRDRDTDGDGDCTDAVGCERLFYCNDGNFNVTALVATNGTVVERYTYDPYGKVTIRDANWQPITWDDSRKNVCLYTGHKYDAESGLYYSLYRYYQPGLGRWAGRDPLLEVRRDADLRGRLVHATSRGYSTVLMFRYKIEILVRSDVLGLVSVIYEPETSAKVPWWTGPATTTWETGIKGKDRFLFSRLDADCKKCCQIKDKDGKDIDGYTLTTAFSLKQAIYLSQDVKDPTEKEMYYGHEQYHVANFIDKTKSRLVPALEKVEGKYKCVTVLECAKGIVEAGDEYNTVRTKIIKEESDHTDGFPNPVSGGATLPRAGSGESPITTFPPSPSTGTPPVPL